MRKRLMKKPVHLLINPKSGYGGRKLLTGMLSRRMRREGLDVAEYTTRCAGDATRYCAEIAEEASAVVVWGGDGTVNEAANALAGKDVPILAGPAGTENLLAKELKIPRDPGKIVETLLNGEITTCDVGRINDRNFLLILGIGFDGEVVKRVTQDRAGHISHLSYILPIWRTFWEHDYPHLRVSTDGEEIFDGRGLIFVGNISRYATGLRICHDAVFNDGLLDMVIFSCSHPPHLMLHTAWTVLKMRQGRDDVIYRKFRSAKIRTDKPVPSQVDGDVGPDTPLDIRVLDDKVKLIVPKI